MKCTPKARSLFVLTSKSTVWLINPWVLDELVLDLVGVKWSRCPASVVDFQWTLPDSSQSCSVSKSLTVMFNENIRWINAGRLKWNQILGPDGKTHNLLSNHTVTCLEESCSDETNNASVHRRQHFRNSHSRLRKVLAVQVLRRNTRSTFFNPLCYLCMHCESVIQQDTKIFVEVCPWNELSTNFSRGFEGLSNVLVEGTLNPKP